MGTSNYSDEFKRAAVHQITVRTRCGLPHRRNKPRSFVCPNVGFRRRGNPGSLLQRMSAIRWPLPKMLDRSLIKIEPVACVPALTSASDSAHFNQVL